MLSKQIIFAAGFIVVGVLLLFIPSERFQTLLPDLLAGPLPVIFHREMELGVFEAEPAIAQLADIIQERREEISSITNTEAEHSITQQQQE